MTARSKEKQALILWFLIAKGGSAWRKDIRPEPSGADRQALESRKLITCERHSQNRLRFEVTDDGWAWANDNLDAALPTKTLSAGPILQDWLTLLKTFLSSRSIPLAEFVVSPKKGAVEGGAEQDRDLKKRIRTTYLELTSGVTKKRVRLADLRSRIEDVLRATLDQELLGLQRSGHVVLYPLDNPREIKPADEEAAIHLAGAARHILYFKD